MPENNRRILRLQQTGSTNSEAMRLALDGEHLPLWVIAETQTAGRGRAGRTWASPPGNFYGSVVLECDAPLQNAGQLSLVAGVALIDAIATIAPTLTGHRLKWPNDVLIDGAKVGGILVESTTAANRSGFIAVLGFGVNIQHAPDDLGRAATSLSQHGAAISRDALADALASTLEARFSEWDSGRGFESVRSAWLERAGPEGEAITVNTNGGRVSGSYRGLTRTGAMLAEIGGTLREIAHGDVTLDAPGEARSP